MKTYSIDNSTSWSFCVDDLDRPISKLYFEKIDLCNVRFNFKKSYFTEDLLNNKIHIDDAITNYEEFSIFINMWSDYGEYFQNLVKSVRAKISFSEKIKIWWLYRDIAVHHYGWYGFSAHHHRGTDGARYRKFISFIYDEYVNKDIENLEKRDRLLDVLNLITSEYNYISSCSSKYEDEVEKLLNAVLSNKINLIPYKCEYKSSNGGSGTGALHRQVSLSGLAYLFKSSIFKTDVHGYKPLTFEMKDVELVEKKLKEVFIKSRFVRDGGFYENE